MKRLFFLSLATICFFGCTNNQIKEAAIGYLTAEGNYKFEEAKPYASQLTLETKIKFEQEIIQPQMDTNAAFAESCKKNTPATITIDEIKKEGKTAVVKYTKTTPIQTQKGELKVIEEDGKWKAHQPIQVPKEVEWASKPIPQRDIKPGELKRVPVEEAFKKEAE
ncbi:MAG: hypothetical protein MJZ62_02925 [Bacteroidales bacterium]|nr:hypothetical protein [Bacteroidales bacterium]